MRSETYAQRSKRVRNELQYRVYIALLDQEKELTEKLGYKAIEIIAGHRDIPITLRCVIDKEAGPDYFEIKIKGVL